MNPVRVKTFKLIKKNKMFIKVKIKQKASPVAICL